MYFKQILLLATIISICFCAIPDPGAATITWSPVGGNNLWTNANNWNLNRLPNNNDVVSFNTPDADCYISGVVSIQGLIISENTNIYLVDSSTTVTVTGISTGAAVFTASTIRIFVPQSASFAINGYTRLVNTIVFDNLGTVNIVPYFDGGSLSLQNTGPNDVIFSASLSLPIVVRKNTNIPSGFRFQSGALSFRSDDGSTFYQLTLNYQETIGGTWSFNTTDGAPHVIFNAGAIISGSFSSVGSNCKVQIRGNVTITSVNSFECDLEFIGDTTLTGLALTFTDRFVTFSSTPLNIFGSAPLTFSQSIINPMVSTINSEVVNIFNPNLKFDGNWRFNGASVQVNFKQSITVDQNYTLNGVTFSYANYTTLNNSGKLRLVGNVIFNDSVIITGALDFLTGVKSFYCNNPNSTFQFFGTGSPTFSSGLTVHGCTLSSQQDFFIQSSFTCNKANCTIPIKGIINNNTTFSSDLNTRSIIIVGTRSITTTNQWTINMEVVAVDALTINTGAIVGGSGILTIASNSLSIIGDNVIIGVLLTFNNGPAQFTSTNKVTIGNLYLRNTQLSGNAQIDFTSLIWVTKGLSSLSMANFRFRGNPLFTQRDDGIGVNTGSQLDISGATNRYYEFPFTVGDYVNVVLRDPTVFNATVTFTTGATLSSITFMQSLLTITGGWTVNFNGVYFFNSTVNIVGQGFVIFNSGTSLFLTSNFNSAGNNNVFITINSCGLYALNDLTVGTSVQFLGNVVFGDNDNLANTANTTLTYAGSEVIFGEWTLGCNVVIGGSLTFSSSTAKIANSPGSLTINGAQLILDGFTYEIWVKVVFTQATTITCSSTSSSAILLLGEANTTFVAHGLSLPTLSLGTSVTLGLYNGGRDFYNVGFSGNIGGNGHFFLFNVVSSLVSPTTSVTFNPQNVSIASSSLSGNYLISPINSITFGGINYALNSATVTNGNINCQEIINSPNPTPCTLSGFSFNTNPTYFSGSSLYFLDKRSVLVKYVTNVNLHFLNDVILSEQITGTGKIFFNLGVTLTTPQTIANNVQFGVSSASLNIISGSQLTLTGSIITVMGTVVSGGASIVSTSVGLPYQFISGGGSIPLQWSWNNTIKLGSLNCTGLRTINLPVQLTSGGFTVFPDGVILNTGAAFLEDNGSGGVRFETSLTNNVNGFVFTDGLDVSITGQLKTFQMAGNFPLNINSTFTCTTPINFFNSVTFGVREGQSSKNFNFGNGCYFLNTSQTITFNRNIFTLSNTLNKNEALYIEPKINFAMSCPSYISPITFSSSTGNITFRGDFRIYGSGLNFPNSQSTFLLGSITIQSFMNNTFFNIYPTASLTFVSSTTPWIEPDVSISDKIGLNQVFNLNGPIKMTSPTVLRGGNFVGNGRVAIVNSLKFNSGGVSPYIFSLGSPLQFYITNLLNPFSFDMGDATNTLILTQNPSTFNPLGSNIPNFDFLISSGTLRFMFSAVGTINVGNVNIPSNTVLRLGSNVIFNALKVTVQDGATVWVDGATCTVENVVFNPTSTFKYTITSSTPPQLQVTSYSFIQGNLVLVVNNFALTNQPIPIITSSNSNINGNFAGVVGTGGIVFSLSRSGNSIVVTTTLAPTPSSFPTQTGTPFPVVSSSSILFANLLFVFAITFLNF